MTAPRSAVDLHLHSTHSDGVLTPEELVALVAAAGVRLCALTDHDTVAGVAPALAAARALGVELLPGVELSAGWRGRTLHVVGLGLAPDAPALDAALAQRASLRRTRAAEIGRRLERAGAPGLAAWREVEAHAQPTRTHYARALVALGAAPDLPAAFARWLGRGRPGDVRAEWPELAESVAAIVQSGGAAVLAHPLRYPFSAGQRRQLAAEFAAAGGAALEVVVGGTAPHQVEAAAGLALRAQLAGSVGSDCHDPALPWHRPGRLAKLPRAVVPVWQRWRPDLPAALEP